MMISDNIELRKAREGDFSDYYQIKCNSENIKWSGFSSPPDREKLYALYLKRINDPDRDIFFGISNGKIVGFTMAVRTSSSIRTSVGVYGHGAGKGVGRTLIRKTALFMRQIYLDTPIVAWIVPQNTASIIAHEAAGYKLIPERQQEDIKMDLIEGATHQLCWEFADGGAAQRPRAPH